MIKTIKIDKIESLKFTGNVYNLELVTNDSAPDHDDLYWVDDLTGIITHNCFPKDLNALIFMASELGISPTVMKAVWEKNNEVRQPEFRDWEEMSGRAVSED